MNTIPLVKGNTQEEINTSLIALKKALDEMNSSSSKTDASAQSQIKQINELIENINTHLDTVDSEIEDLQPVDSVTSGNMQSVTSNAVATALNALGSKANMIKTISGNALTYKLNQIVGDYAFIILQNGSGSGSYNVGIYTEYNGYRIDWIHNNIPTVCTFDSSTTELTIVAYTRIMIIY